jgi:guanosine-3',5'-bis(diphosphate) 3'-pyrophosphohydrolase
MDSAPSSLPPATEEPAYRVFLDSLDYLSSEEIARIEEAYVYSAEKHANQKRMSGEAYITHPLAVAGAVVEWRMDSDAIMAALLHDVLEDTGTTKRELSDKFGREVAELVDGLSKLDKMEFASYQESAAENFRKMLMAMARDLRVVLIKLADRQHNLQTMSAMRPDKQRRIATETLRHLRTDCAAPRAEQTLPRTAGHLVSPDFTHGVLKFWPAP